MTNATNSSDGPDASRPAPAIDLADFHLRWTQFRPTATALLASGRCTGQEAEIVRWLVELADRIGPRDIQM